MDYSSLLKASAIPGAAAMIETFRAIGYSLETAVADIIDNSISAEAKNIYFLHSYFHFYCIYFSLGVCSTAEMD